MKLQDQIAVVTGAGSGIGRSLAVRLAQEGCHVAICDVNEAGLKETAEQVEALGRKTYSARVDVSQREEVESFCNAVVEEFGAVHVLINNAGVTVMDTVENISWEDFERVMNINFWGMVYGSKIFLPHLKKASQSYLVNISSIFGIIAIPGQAAYNASKFGIRGFTEALSHEMEGESVHVVSVHPGAIKTNIVNNASYNNDGRILKSNHEKFARKFDRMAKTTPDETADIIVKGMLAKKFRVLPGEPASKVDFLQRLFPATYRKILRKFM